MKSPADSAHADLLGGLLPAVRLGFGPPLVALAGLTGANAVPTGFERTMQVRRLAPLTEHFTVHLVNRRPGLDPDTTMSDLAADQAVAIREAFGAPVPVIGESTGGSVALQLAIDHPDTVARLVLASSGYTLGEGGRTAQATLARSVSAGRPRSGWAALSRPMTTNPVIRSLVAGLLWLTAPMMTPADPSDLLATLRAEDSFDALSGLAGVRCPTLVIAGDRDGFYSPEIFAATAGGIRGARLVLYPGRGHGIASFGPATTEILSFLGVPGSSSG